MKKILFIVLLIFNLISISAEEWEYKEITRSNHYSSYSFESELNNLGRLGYELVSTYTIISTESERITSTTVYGGSRTTGFTPNVYTKYVVYIFKRKTNNNYEQNDTIQGKNNNTISCNKK